MKTQRAHRHHGRKRRLACAAVVAAASRIAAAQEALPADRLHVEVTGSNIRRTDIETALPVQVITREEIARSGALTVAEVMARVSANFMMFNEVMAIGDQVIGSGDHRPGLASVNLRGIGESSTLVLVNGRRVANYAFDGGSVDVNSIPLSAIDRVEILKDGASAIYGTDAVAGVVNFILRNDFRGLDVTLTGGVTQHVGGDRQRATATGGWGDLARDRVNAFLSLDYVKEGAISTLDRPFSRTAYRPERNFRLGLGAPFTFPANIEGPGGAVLSPALASGCNPPEIIPVVRRGALICGADIASDLVPPAERASAMGRATVQINPDLHLIGEAGYTKNRVLFRVAATPLDEGAVRNPGLAFYPAGGPFYPTQFAAANGLSGDLPLFYRTQPLGLRTSLVTTQALRALAGVEGRAGGWDFSSAVLYSRTWENDSLVSGWVSNERILAALASGLVNPFGPSGAEGDALLSATQVSGEIHRAVGSTLLVDAKASRELFALAGGPLAIAVGADARKERLDNAYTALSDRGDVVSLDHPDGLAGSRTAQAAFVEFGVPFLKGVETQIAARYDHYSDFGSTVNPKVAVRWQPLRSLLLRASWGTGFRAPTLPELFAPVVRGVTNPEITEDPLRCPITGQPRDCEGNFTTLSGGNPALHPEKSSQYNLGVVWSPSPSLSFGIDYWNLRKRDAIFPLDEFTIFGEVGRASTSIRRGPIDPAFPNLPGPIDAVLLWNQNIGNLRTSGVDIDVAWRTAETGIGRFGFRFNGTYIIELADQYATPDYTNYVGTNDAGVVPRWRHSAAVDWSRGAWSATLAQTFQYGYTEADLTQCDDSGCGRRRVGDYSVWDVQVQYTGFRNTMLALGVKNLFDRNPPATFVTSGRFAVGYDPQYADPRGRMFYATATYSFK